MCATAVLAVAFVAAPALEQRPELLGRWLSDYLGRQVTLRKFEFGWSNGAPLLRIRDLKLIAQRNTGNSFRLDTAEVRVDTMRSIRERGIRAQAVIVRGASIHVRRTEDGAAIVAGLGQKSKASTDELFANLRATLPADAVLGIEQSTVTLYGFRAQSADAQPLVLYPVSAHLHHGNDGVRFSASAAIRNFPQSSIRATARWRDRSSSPLSESEFTLSASELPISELPQHLRPTGVSGRISFAIDGQFAAHSIATMRGSLKLDELGAVGDSLPRQTVALQSLIEYIHDDVDWRLTLLRLQAKTATGFSTPSTLTLSGAMGAAPSALTLDHMPVSTLLPLLHSLGAASSTELARLTTSLSPVGRIEELQLALVGDLSSMQPGPLQVQLRDIEFRSASHHLRMGPFNASLNAHGKNGSINLKAAPIRLEQRNGPQGNARGAQFAAAGILRWRRSEDELLLATDGLSFVDGELRMQLEGALGIAQSQAPATFDLAVHGVGLDERSFKRYLALGLIPAPLTAWFERSIGSGRLSRFDAQIKGSPRSAVEIVNLLHLEASFENATLLYLDQWPKLTAMNGQFTLKDNQFSFNIDSARVSGAQIRSTRGQIADVLSHQPSLTVQGTALGRAEQGTSFISATPLAPKFAPLMRQLDAKGDAALALGLTIPLTGDGPIKVRGELKLKQAALRVRALRSALSDVSGAIVFDAQGLTNAALKAHYLHREITMSLHSLQDSRDNTRLRIDGATDPQGLIRHLYDVGALDSDDRSALPLLGRLSGLANWQVSIDFAQPDVGAETITMTVQSDLVGMALNLPQPMGKAALESRQLKVTSTLLSDKVEDRRFNVHYGDALHAVLEMTAQRPNGFALQRGAFRLGGGEAILTSEQGISVDGAVAVFSVDDWATLIAELQAQPKMPNQPLRSMSLLQRVQVRAQRLVAVGAVFDDVALRVSRDTQGSWLIATNGKGIDGTISITEPIGDMPIDARFTRLHVRRETTTDSANAASEHISIEPGSLPSAHVVVQRLRYNDLELGLAKLVLEPSDNGLLMREIFALSEAFEIRGTGRWTGSVGNAESSFDLRLHSNDFGRFTQALGYGDGGIEGGVAEIAIEANWLGSPFDFGLDRMQGELHFRATGGRLLDLEPGATGRAFGLLNMTVLPRRLLLLDFEDLFKKGVSYELIEGSFALAHGNAQTQNVVMHTETAQVNLTGRVGLIAQDYDQVMTVTPKLSASLPLAPIWLAEKLLKRKLIDSAFAYQYIITGAWEDAKIERVRIEVPVAEAN